MSLTADAGQAGSWANRAREAAWEALRRVQLMESDAQPLGANHFAIRVDDIDAAVSDLLEQGVEVHRIPFIPGAGHQAFLHDPFGNLIELNQPQ